MGKKSVSGKKPSGAAAMAVVEDSAETASAPEETVRSNSASETPAAAPKAKAKEEPATSGSVGLGDIRKAAAFANSVGGLDKALALLQILKVAKEVQ